MYIRKTKIKNSKQGDAYYSYRIVESIREGDKVKQKTLLNLGKHFDIESALWPSLITRIEQLLQQNQTEVQVELFDLQLDLDETLEKAAQRYAALIIHKQSQPVVGRETQPLSAQPGHHFETVDINQLSALKARSIGVETLAWQAVKQLKLDSKLTALGFNGRDRAAALGNIIGRMIAPGSERSTHYWLTHQTALGELMEHDYDTTKLTRLYTVADDLLRSQSDLESFLYQQEKDLFHLKQTIILYDLTNTYFEGHAKANPKAQFGHSKEKRSDCKLVTMGLVIDSAGFPMNSRLFSGNASEPQTLKEMIDGLHQEGLPTPVIVLDAGIASQENIDWLQAEQYQYIVVSRERHKENPQDSEQAVVIKEEQNNRVIAKRVADDKAQEVRLYCHSEKREKTDAAIRSRFHQRFEQALEKLHQGLSKKGCTKRYEKVLETIGRIKQKNSRVAQDYDIVVTADEHKKNARSITFKRVENSQAKDKLAGVYCLRSNILDWTEEQLWQTYVMLTDLEATFRSLKTELGLRPVYHQKEDRVTAHLWITLLAYHLVHTIRYQLKAKGINLSWHSIRQVLSTVQRITIAMPTQDHQMVYVRTTTKPEPLQKKIYEALNISADLIGNTKTSIDKTKKSVVPTGTIKKN